MRSWTLTHITTFFCLTVVVAMIASYSASSAKEPFSFAGRWSDVENSGIKMSVREDGGVFRVVGGDETFGYRLSCLVKEMKAVCIGNGGKLEGENFLYQSTIVFSQAGDAIESWKAFNNLQTVSGKTTWKRQ